jgi:hypothetical protein
LAVAASRGAQQHDRVVASAGLFFMTKTPDEAELLGVHIVHGERTTYDAVRALAPLSVTDDSDHSFFYNQQRSHPGEQFPYVVRHTFAPEFQGIGCILQIVVPGGDASHSAVDFFQKALGVGAFLPDYTNLPTMMVRGERLSDGYSEIGIAVASSW